MREIKFRAWDGKKMIRTHNLMLDCYDGRAYWQFGYQQPEPMEPGVVLMQFTGLKDRNGVEIYEGDIVSTPSATSEKIRVVSYLAPAFLLQRKLGDTIDVEEFSTPLAKEEVIGNIHENPGLLSTEGGKCNEQA